MFGAFGGGEPWDVPEPLDFWGLGSPAERLRCWRRFRGPTCPRDGLQPPGRHGVHTAIGLAGACARARSPSWLFCGASALLVDIARRSRSAASRRRPRRDGSTAWRADLRTGLRADPSGGLRLRGAGRRAAMAVLHSAQIEAQVCASAAQVYMVLVGFQCRRS